MNYLAHAYLSFGQPGLLVGNMISDFVKGKKQYDYPDDIVKGIKLHRAIDDFTDNHPSTRQAKTHFKGAYRLYAGAFIDVVFDHFLAIHPLYFSTEDSLQHFAGTTYHVLQQHQPLLPQRFQQMLPYMQQQNWLYNYRQPEGIRQSMGRLVRRSAYLTDAAPGYLLFQQHYTELQFCFGEMFPQLIEMTREFINKDYNPVNYRQ